MTELADAIRTAEADPAGVELELRQPDTTAAKPLEQMSREELIAFARSTVQIIREPKTYERHGDYSYFKDFVLAERHQDPAATARLERHAVEWQIETREREVRAMRTANPELRAVSWAPGAGGNFAPPLWLIEQYADVPRAERIIARLAPNLELPRGPQEINLPVLTGGTTTQDVLLDQPAPDTDIADSASRNNVTTIVGQEDVPLALLEQSPLAAPLDWVIFKALKAGYEEKLEQQLVNGTGVGQILGILNVKGINAIAYNLAPEGTTLYPVLGKALAAIGRQRKIPPEAWLINTPRFAWIGTSEDKQERPLLLSDNAGSDFPTADLASFPVYLDDGIPTLPNGQEPMIACCPSDFLVLESLPVTDVMFEPLAGEMQARLQMRSYVAGITNRYPTGISVVSGTGMVPVAGF